MYLFNYNYEIPPKQKQNIQTNQLNYNLLKMLYKPVLKVLIFFFLKLNYFYFFIIFQKTNINLRQDLC